MQKLLAVALAALLHSPLFWQVHDELQHGESRSATAAQSGVTLKLASRPAPAPATATAEPAVKPAPALPAKAVTRPAPQPVAPAPAETRPQTEQVSTRESSNETEEDGNESQQQAIGGQTMGLGGSSASGTDEDALALYKGIIHNRIQRLHHYPQQARMRNQQGTVEITFAVDAHGAIASYRISRSSGSQQLDRAAERLFSRLKLPAPDPSILAELADLTVPVTFRLDGL